MAEELDWTLKLIDELSGPAKQMTSQLTALNQMMFKVMENTAKAEKATKKSDKAHGGFLDTVHKVTSTVHDGIEIAEGFAHGIIHIAEAIVDAIAEEEKFVQQLKLLSGSDEVGDAIAESIEKIRPVAVGTENDLKAMAAQILKVGFAAEELSPVLAGALDIKALRGEASAEKFVEVLGKIQTRGEATKKEVLFLNQALGLKNASKEAIKNGSDVTKVLDAVAHKIGGPLGTASQKAAGNLETLLARAKESPKNFLEGFKDIGAIKTAKSVLSNFLDTLGPGTSLFKSLQKTAGDAITKITDMLFGGFAGPGGKKRVEDFAATVNGFLEKLPGYVENAIDVLKVLSSVIGGVATAFDVVGTTIGETFAGAFLFITETIPGFFGMISKFATDLYDSAIEFGSNLWKGIVDGVGRGIQNVKDAVGEMADSIKDGIAGALGIQSPSKVFQEYGMQSAAGFAKGLDQSNPMLGNSVGSTFSGAASSSAQSGGGTSATANVIVNVSVDGSHGGKNAAEEIASHLDDILPGRLNSMFEHLAMQFGEGVA